MELYRDPRFERQGIGRCEQTDAGNRGPQRQWLVLQDEPARGRADEPADLPRRARERHVAAEQPWLGEVDDERRVDRPVQAFAQSEDTDCDAEDDRGLCAG